jgi:hypothetical protein
MISAKELLKKAEQYNKLVRADDISDAAKLQDAENKAITDVIGGNFAGTFRNVSNGPTVRS